MDDEERGGKRLVAMMALGVGALVTTLLLTFWPALVAGVVNTVTIDTLAGPDRANLRAHGVGPELVAKGYRPAKWHEDFVLWDTCPAAQEFAACAKATAEADGRFILTAHGRNWRGAIDDVRFAAVGFPAYLRVGRGGTSSLQVCPAPPHATFDTLFTVARPSSWGACK